MKKSNHNYLKDDTKMTTTELTTKVELGAKKVMNGVLQKLQVYGFWCLLLIGIGFAFGVKYADIQTAKDMNKALKLNGFVYNDKPYNITPKVVQ
jgi:hypothetical protein